MVLWCEPIVEWFATKNLESNFEARTNTERHMHPMSLLDWLEWLFPKFLFWTFLSSLTSSPPLTGVTWPCSFCIIGHVPCNSDGSHSISLIVKVTEGVKQPTCEEIVWVLSILLQSHEWKCFGHWQWKALLIAQLKKHKNMESHAYHPKYGTLGRVRPS